MLADFQDFQNDDVKITTSFSPLNSVVIS